MRMRTLSIFAIFFCAANLFKRLFFLLAVVVLGGAPATVGGRSTTSDTSRDRHSKSFSAPACNASYKRRHAMRRQPGVALSLAESFLELAAELLEIWANLHTVGLDEIGEGQ